MKKLFLPAVIAVCCTAFFCIFPTLSDRDKPRSAASCGMAEITSAGKSFFQGWNDSTASLDERPGMMSSFTYNYWIDTVEVTQKHYFDVTGKNPVPDSSKHGVGDEFPVYYVTWFDAALFCNERSKQEKLDTVYSYAAKRELPDGRVYDLTGIRCNVAVDGYRLPTESEWEFAARADTIGIISDNSNDSTHAINMSWFSANSSNSAHRVASKLPNHYGLYDMAGNLFEWTNDWKCGYTGEPIENSLGALQPNYDNEKVIKGGSFNYPITYLRPSRRSADYPTTVSAACEYVGFRCLRGVVSQGSYIGIESTDFIPNPVMVIASNSTVRNFAGTSSSRLVLVNVTGTNRTLCFVDFNRTFPFVREYLDDKKVYMPVVSPDGRYVAYCSANEGQFGASRITIRSLDSLSSPRVTLASDSATIPRWWIDRSTGDTCIIYVNSAVANSSSLWKTSKTFIQTISAGLPVGTPHMLLNDGAYHDGRSVDGRYLVTAFDRLMVRDLFTGQQQQLFLYPENGKDPSGSSQVCNASLSPDTGVRTRCLFLDFGSPQKSTITGQSYNIHEYLFISTMDGIVTNALQCPDNEKSWDFCEWSNQTPFVVSSARDVASRAGTVYAVDLEHGAYLPVVTGTELQHPFWWIREITENPFKFALDSLGCYDDPHVDGIQSQFSYMMHFFWSRAPELDVLFFGHSQVMGGIDCTAFSSLKSSKIAFNGCGFRAFSLLIENYVFVHAPNIKVICINVPFYTFSQPGAELDPFWWDRTIGASKGFIYDRNHNFWRDSIPDGFYQSMTKAPYTDRPDLDTFGLALWSCEGWGGPDPDLSGSIDWTVEDTNYQNNMVLLENLVTTLAVKKIHLVAINFPESPYYRSTTHYMLYGPSWETAAAVLRQLVDLDAAHPNFHFYDAYQNGNHDYDDGDARDWNHLCATGAAKLTLRIEALIDSALAVGP